VFVQVIVPCGTAVSRIPFWFELYPVFPLNVPGTAEFGVMKKLLKAELATVLLVIVPPTF
jgi:hypothetical protein